MIEGAELANYGVLGVWTLFNLSTILYYRKKDDGHDTNMAEVVKNNTVAMTKVYEIMRSCASNRA